MEPTEKLLQPITTLKGLNKSGFLLIQPLRGCGCNVEPSFPWVPPTATHVQSLRDFADILITVNRQLPRRNRSCLPGTIMLRADKRMKPPTRFKNPTVVRTPVHRDSPLSTYPSRGLWNCSAGILPALQPGRLRYNMATRPGSRGLVIFSINPVAPRR